jgi:hypothetical protein
MTQCISEKPIAGDTNTAKKLIEDYKQLRNEHPELIWRIAEVNC